MISINAHLNRIEQRLTKARLIDPEIAIKTMMKFIDLSCYQETIPEEKRISFYEFIRMSNNEFSLYQGSYELETRKELWRNMESDIRNKNGFKSDARDEEAIKIKEF